MTIIMQISGLQPDKISTNVLRLYEGQVSHWDGSLEAILSPLNHYDINMATVGAGGLDEGSPVSGYDYFPYILSRQSDGAFGAVLSHHKYLGDVVAPSGWSVIRKLRFGFSYNTSWDGIPNFHVAHWPHPTIRYTDAEYSSLWMPLNGGTASSFTAVDLSPYLPDNARMAHILAEVRYNSGSAGSGYLRSYNGQSTGILIGSASPGSPFPGQVYLPIRVDSLRHLEYKCTGNVAMYIQVLGYDMTEPS